MAMPFFIVGLIVANSDAGALAVDWSFLAVPALWSVPGLLAVLAMRGRRPLFVACGVTVIALAVTTWSIGIVMVFLSPALFAGYNRAQSEVGCATAAGAAFTALAGTVAAGWVGWLGATTRCWEIPHGEACSTGVIPPASAAAVVGIVAATVWVCARIVPKAVPGPVPGPAAPEAVDYGGDPQG